MPVAAGWVLVALVAVLVGAALPVLFQLKRTLKAAETTLDTTGKNVNEALTQLSTTLERVNSAADELDRGVKKVASLLAALGSLGDALYKVRSTVGTVASVGSIVSGAILAAMGLRGRNKDREADRQESTEEPKQEQEQVR